MAFLHRLGSLLRASWPWLRIPFWLVMGLLFGFLLPYTLILNARLQDRFNDLVFAVPTRVYARPLLLEPGRAMSPAALELELTFAGYTADGAGKVQGSYSKNGSRFIINSRGYAGPDGGELAHRLRVALADGQIASVVDDANGKPIKAIHL
ncbi:MAG: penicillin-binding protein 1B, partial [Luteibacter sp.]